MYYPEIKKSIYNVGVRRGDLIYIHASMIPFFIKVGRENCDVFLKELCDSILSSVGIEGTVCFPAFDYSFTKNKVFNPNEPPGKAMGILPATLWKTKQGFRTMDPIFSVYAIGRLGEELTKSVPKTCFGKNSFFDRFYRRKGKTLQINMNVAHTTFVIYFDQRLKKKYRYFKRFSGYVQVGDELIRETWITYVRYLDGTPPIDLEALRKEAEQDISFKSAKLMGIDINCIEIDGLFQAAKRI
jgi:aminoglycoside 3-N-acetyltransferase